uniref:USP domain-containing protein n=1 Tax=viral metagenome TaxID=1070528 RepID=A0A6C0IXB0_9ZZZZ
MEKYYKKGLCGITNLGNTCFMNSIIQCINANRDLSEFFVNYTIDINNLETKLVKEWMILSKSLYSKNAVVTPESFHQTIQMLSIKKNNDTFSGYNQNDSQEFLQFFLENLHTGLSKEVNMNVNGTALNELDKMAIKALNNWKLYFKNDYSKIIDIYYGQFYSKISCLDDKEFKTESYDPFSNISLEIPDKEDVNIFDCFDNFCKEESIEFKTKDDDEKNYIKKLNIWRFPEHLIIFFKRFNNNGQKINKIIDFPIENLNLNKYCVGYDQNDSIYDLYAISNHEGNILGGHYWAYTKNADKNWYKFNDKYVTLANISDLINENVYCLFYKKKK